MCLLPALCGGILTDTNGPNQEVPQVFQLVKLSNEHVVLRWAARHEIQLIDVEILPDTDTKYPDSL